MKTDVSQAPSIDYTDEIRLKLCLPLVQAQVVLQVDGSKIKELNSSTTIHGEHTQDLADQKVNIPPSLSSHPFSTNRLMDYDDKTREELMYICKEKDIVEKSKMRLCQSIIKKGPNKGNACGKPNCKRHDERVKNSKQNIQNSHSSKNLTMPFSEPNIEAKTDKIEIAITDFFVAVELKLNNGKNGHGERRLYTGDSHEKNEKLTDKPWKIIFPENYFNDIKDVLSNKENFAKEFPNREENVLKCIKDLQGKNIYVNTQNGIKDVRRYYVGPQKPDKKNIKLWDTLRKTLIPKYYKLELIECDDHYVCQPMNIKINQQNCKKKNNSVSNIQIEFFKYLEKKLDIEIQGGHNSAEFQLRNPKNGYYWPIDGIHVCGNHKCSGNKDVPCSYNMNVWEFQGDYFHCNPNKYSKFDKFHNVEAETKWDKDRNKKEFYESQGYKVNIVWESEWIDEKKQIKSEGKKWTV